MANVIGWSREDLERLQPVDVSPWNALHPVQSQPNQQSNPQQTPQQLHTLDDTSGNWQELPIPYSPPEKIPSPPKAPVEGVEQQHGETRGSGKILGLRRTTFFLTVSNILLAIALIVLGVVQSQVLRSSSGTATSLPAGLDAQQSSCPSIGSSPSITGSVASTSTSATAAAAPTGKVCFATDKSITSAVALGDVISECPLPDGKANYTVPGTGLTFERVCETDYPSDDLAWFPVISMLDCIHLCAQLNLYPASARGRCVGVSWVYADGPQGTGLSFCYPKSATNRSQTRAATESARLIVE
ncbi:hypothetical protein N657DRAFT_623915 [Parathielavia appendiculata]|uniref:Uncharacterized protein n=1 Tax=Parathielavia appendiculata TaxID=2587402 RepID=A0AAN6Z0J1_9PEZI|nr:hypothetical protein N657DRAFT_623915 [Parathielavia appendiculata]